MLSCQLQLGCHGNTYTRRTLLAVVKNHRTTRRLRQVQTHTQRCKLTLPEQKVLLIFSHLRWCQSATLSLFVTMITFCL